MLQFTENPQRSAGLAVRALDRTARLSVTPNPSIRFASAGAQGPPGADGDAGVVQSVVAGSNITVDNTDPANPIVASSAAGVTDGDKGDVVVSSSGTVWTVDPVTGSGSFVRATSPTLVTPVLGTPSSVTLTNGTGLPIATGVSGLGTGVATALGINTGSAGAVVLFNGALGTPSSGTLSSCSALPLIDSTGSCYAQIDSDNNSTSQVFQVRNNSATAGGGSLLFEVSETGQVVIGTSAVAANRKFYVQQTDTDTNASNGHAAIECRQDYSPAGDSSANPDGIYGTLWYNSAHAFTGAGAAVRGNAYTISQGASNVDVTNLIGVYGRPRQEAAGTVTNAISLYADGAQTIAGTTTNAMSLWCDSQTAATNNYGVYFENNPNGGSLAAPTNVTISTKVTGTGTVTLGTAGGTATLTAAGQLTAPKVGVGTETDPQTQLAVSAAGSTGIASLLPSSAAIQIISGDNATSVSGLFIGAFGSTITGAIPTCSFRSGRGTAASPTATQSGDQIGRFGGGGYGASQFSTTDDAGIFFVAAESFTNSAHGTNITFNTKPTGSDTRAEVGRFSASGGLSVGTTTDAGIGAILANTHIRSRGATSGIGYATGAGGTVTQLTNKSTGVTLNTVTGQITMNGAALGADTTVSFTLTNSAVAAGDILTLNHLSGGTAGSYLLNAQSAGGSASINVRNITAGSLSEAIVISYAVIKAVTS